MRGVGMSQVEVIGIGQRKKRQDLNTDVVRQVNPLDRWTSHQVGNAWVGSGSGGDNVRAELNHKPL